MIKYNNLQTREVQVKLSGMILGLKDEKELTFYDFTEAADADADDALATQAPVDATADGASDTRPSPLKKRNALISTIILWGPNGIIKKKKQVVIKKKK